MTDKPMLMLLSQNDLDALRLTANDLDHMLLCKLERYDDGLNQPTGDATHQPSQ